LPPIHPPHYSGPRGAMFPAACVLPQPTPSPSSLPSPSGTSLRVTSTFSCRLGRVQFISPAARPPSAVLLSHAHLVVLPFSRALLVPECELLPSFLDPSASLISDHSSGDRYDSSARSLSAIPVTRSPMRPGLHHLREQLLARRAAAQAPHIRGLRAQRRAPACVPLVALSPDLAPRIPPAAALPPHTSAASISYGSSPFHSVRQHDRQPLSFVHPHDFTLAACCRVLLVLAGTPSPLPLPSTRSPPLFRPGSSPRGVGGDPPATSLLARAGPSAALARRGPAVGRGHLPCCCPQTRSRDSASLPRCAHPLTTWAIWLALHLLVAPSAPCEPRLITWRCA